MTALAYALWALAAGALIPVMAILNAGLARSVGGPTQAAVVLFLTGLAATVVLALLTRSRWPELHALRSIGPSRLAGGLIVAFYVLSITWLAPRFGVGNAILFAVTAQLATSALIDHFGLFGAVVRPLTTLRLTGLGIVVAGVAITQLSARR